MPHDDGGLIVENAEIAGRLRAALKRMEEDGSPTSVNFAMGMLYDLLADLKATSRGPSREEFDDLAKRLKTTARTVGVLQEHLITLYSRLGHPRPMPWPTPDE